jgi:hypothetical protein
VPHFVSDVSEVSDVGRAGFTAFVDKRDSSL